jgi:serine/threonine protein kinase
VADAHCFSLFFAAAAAAVCVLLQQDRIRIACETVSALVFLHSAPEPIIHMDLKPGNLLLNRSLLCKVRQQQQQQHMLLPRQDFS